MRIIGGGIWILTERIKWDGAAWRDLRNTLIRSGRLMTSIDVYMNQEVRIKQLDQKIEILERLNECLSIDNDFMLCLLREIESAIEHEDKQRISVAIKQLRGQLGTEKLYQGNLKRGLVRE